MGRTSAATSICIKKEEEVLRMVCIAPDLGGLCDATGLSANHIFGMKSVSALVPRRSGKGMKACYRPATLWTRNLSLQQCVVTRFYFQWLFATPFFRARGVKIF
jgi:hypothetical protein